MDRTQFENLFIHARLLPELALAQMAQQIMSMSGDEPPMAISASFAPSGGEVERPAADGPVQAAPGDAVDWFGASGLSDDEIRQLRESAERELAEFNRSAQAADAAAPALQAAPPEFDLGEPLDFAHELQLAYAQRAAVASIAARAFESVDAAQLDAMLARVAGDTTSLTSIMSADDLAGWLDRVNAEEPALMALLRSVARQGDQG